MGAIDKERIELACTKCRKKFRETVGRMKAKGVTCPGCGDKLAPDLVRKAVDRAEKELAKQVKAAVDEARKSLKKLLK